MRTLIAIVSAITMAVTLTTAVLAAPPHRGCPVGADYAGGSTIGAWRLMDQAEFAAAIAAEGYDPAIAASYFAAGDKNDDGKLCVMPQTLPNEASGDDTYWLLHDNNQHG